MLEKLAYVLLGVIIPAICFALSIPKYPEEPRWQFNKWSGCLLMVPSGRIGYPFYPLLLYSIG